MSSLKHLLRSILAERRRFACSFCIVAADGGAGGARAEEVKVLIRRRWRQDFEMESSSDFSRSKGCGRSARHCQ